MKRIDTLRSSHRDRPQGLTIALVYAVFVAAFGALMLAMRWPAALLSLLSTPIVLIALNYPRRVYLSAWVIWVAASAAISQRASSDVSSSLMAILLGGSTVLLLLELVHAYVSDRSRAKIALEQRNRELTALNSVSTTITATLNLEELLQRIVDTVVALFPQVTSATLQLADDKQDVLRTVTASPRSIPARGEKSVVFRPGKGIAGQAMAERRSINVSDVSATTRYVPGNEPPTYCSLLVTPLVVGQRVWGTLSLAGDTPGAFGSSDERLVESFARQAAIAIENAHLYRETDRRAQEQETVASIVRALSASFDVEQAFPSIVKGLQQLTDCERIGLVLFDEPNRQFTVVALSATVPGLDRGNTFPYAALGGIPELLAGRPHLTPDLAAESEYPIGQILLRAGFRSALNLPLVAGEKVIGALNLGSRQLAAFGENHLPLFRQIADAIAASIIQSSLFDRVHSAEAQYRSLFEHSPDAIAVLDPDGVLIDVNPAACRVTGRAREELIGRNIGVINDIPQPSFRKAIEKALSGKAVVYEFGTLVGNRMRYYEAHLARIERETGAALQWVAHDITARRELDHWREELTGITVHNLRNPLTWVQTGTEVARMFLPDETDPDVFIALDKAIKGAYRLEQQIDLLLNINRAEAGQELTDQEPVLVQSLVNDVIELLSPRASAHRVRLRTELPETLPVVLGNRNMLSWSLENLVDNAIKFNPENEEVIVRAVVDVAPNTLQTALRISVIDRGPGIPPGDRERIFRKFYQVRRPERKTGSGMGLYFCRLAVEAHGGRLWVDNNLEGAGCTFSFTLPVPTD